jgi:hypothetical protein
MIYYHNILLIDIELKHHLQNIYTKNDTNPTTKLKPTET